MTIEATPVPVSLPVSDIDCDDQLIIRHDTTTVDGCPALTKIKAFQSDMAVCSTLEWTFVNQNGKAIDLTNCIGDDSAISDDGGLIITGPILRLREALAPQLRPTLFELEGIVTDPVNGVVQVTLTPEIVAQPCIFEMSWGFFDETGQLIIVNRSILSIERDLFRAEFLTSGVRGAMTIGEVRLSIRDEPSHNLLLDDFEFDGAEILHSIIRPIQEWNDTPPPVRAAIFNTHTFPFREHWLRAVQGYLFETAGHGYRRNQLKYSAGGNTVDDQNKEREYIGASQSLLQNWRYFIKTKKVSINAQGGFGSIGSLYGGHF